MAIRHVTALVTNCWMTAEKNAQRLVRSHHHDAGEEFITELFRGEFRAALEAATASGAVRKAFLTDLYAAFGKIPHNRYDLPKLAHGISATLTWHPRETERKTGGDLGLVLARPNFQMQRFRAGSFKLSEYRRGLLCQAKLKRRQTSERVSTWGDFTAHQKKVLKERTSYLALVLYEYGDLERTRLNAFQWQKCTGVKLSEVQMWLRNGLFPELLDSERIIRQLGENSFGTADKKIIDEIIAPPLRDALVIRIWWPKDAEPPDEVLLAHSIHHKVPEVLKVWVGC